MEREQIFQNTLVKHYGLPLVEGSLAGLIATVPMTIVMLAVQYLLPQWQQYALPPERFTAKFARRVGLKKHMSKPQLLVASFISHLGFGATMGAIYGLLTRIIPLSSVLKGSVFGIVVWLAVYLGWLPAIGMSEAATRQPIQRNGLMIVAHLVWGAVTGGMMNLLEGVFGSLIRNYILKKVS
jgi:putative membrane protein